MASSTKQFLSLALLLILSCSCSKAQARESKFFSKATLVHSTTKNVVEVKPIHIEAPVAPPEYVPMDSPTPAPALAPETAPVVAPVSSETGYGLYGHGSGMLPPEKETETIPATTTDKSGSEATLTRTDDNLDFESEPLNEEFNTESEGKEEYMNNNDNNKENVYSNNYNLYGATSNKNTDYTESYKSPATNSNDGYYYPSNSNVNQRQGMSDTRFVESGKYYYDVNRSSTDDENTYEPADDQKEGYTTASEGSYENESNRYDPDTSKYMFNTMEEYYQSQGYHQSNPEEYIP